MTKPNDLLVHDHSPQRPRGRRLLFLVPGLLAVAVALACYQAIAQSSGTQKGAAVPAKKADAAKRKQKNIACTPTPGKDDLQVIQALQQEMTVSWNATRLADAVSQLEKDAKVTIVLDEKSIANTRTTPDTAVDLDIKEGTFGGVLNAVLPRLELDYLIEDGKLIVVSRRDAIEKTFDRTYVLRNAKEARAVISELLKITHARDEWGDVGGYATLQFDEKKLELRIRHTCSDHMRIYSFLSGR